MAVWVLVWWYAHHHALALGAHRWDDSRYVSRAVLGTYDAGIRNRYVHVWGLRLFLGLFDSPLAATLHYATSVGSLLIVLAYALGRHAGGVACGLLSAALLALYPPLFRYYSAPMTDAPSIMYGALGLLAVLVPASTRIKMVLTGVSGLLCFLAFKCKESGITVLVPILWVLLDKGRGPRWLLPFGAGVVVGQLGLCIADLVITGDAFPSLKGGQARKYTKLLTREPFRNEGSRNLMQHEWLELLLGRELRGYTVLGAVGLALGAVRRRTALLLGLWGVATLLFYAFVTYRYSGIDARIRYLIAFALPLCIGSAMLLTDLWRKRHSVIDGASPGQRLLYWAGSLAAVWFAYRGVDAGVAGWLGETQRFSQERAAYFLLPMLLPLGLFVASTAPYRLARRLSVAALVVGVGLSALPMGINYIRKHRRAVAGWQVMGRQLDAQGLRAFAYLRDDPQPMNRDLVTWRMHGLSHQQDLTHRVIASVAGLGEGELVVVSRRKHRQARLAGLQEIAVLEINDRRYHAFQRKPAP